MNTSTYKSFTIQSIFPPNLTESDTSPAFQGNLAQSSDCVNLKPALKDIPEGTYLKPLYFVLNNGAVFIDKKLPTEIGFKTNLEFSSSYFTDLFTKVSSLNTFNYNGARIKLSHSKINVKRFRELLPSNFDDLALLQYLDYGFPLGLVEDFILQPNFKK